jgi:hypothetical protein
LSGKISAVGTNQIPVSPKNVFVAGRVAESGEELLGCWLDVVGVDCAAAPADQIKQVAMRAMERSVRVIRLLPPAETAAQQ